MTNKRIDKQKVSDNCVAENAAAAAPAAVATSSSRGSSSSSAAACFTFPVQSAIAHVTETASDTNLHDTAQAVAEFALGD